MGTNFATGNLHMSIFYRPEALGVVTGCLFLITLFLFIPVPFTNYIFNDINFPYNEVCNKQFSLDVHVLYGKFSKNFN